MSAAYTKLFDVRRDAELVNVVMNLPTSPVNVEHNSLFEYIKLIWKRVGQGRTHARLLRAALAVSLGIFSVKGGVKRGFIARGSN